MGLYIVRVFMFVFFLFLWIRLLLGCAVRLQVLLKGLSTCSDCSFWLLCWCWDNDTETTIMSDDCGMVAF